MSDQLFQDQILNLVLNFGNPQKRDIEAADKVATHLSLALRDIIKDSLLAGKSVADVAREFAQLDPILKSLHQNAGAAGLDQGVIRQAQKAISYYTPERIEKTGQFSEVRRMLGVESSSSESLRDALREYLRERKEASRKQLTENQFYRVTGSNPIGKALVVDTETAFRQGPRSPYYQPPQYLAEFTATLISFNKQSGEILDAQKESYHGLNDFVAEIEQRINKLPKAIRSIVQEDYLRSLTLPRAITPQGVAGAAISAAAISSLARQADFAIAHNAPFDKAVSARYAPSLQQIPWLDTMRGIPWREMGFLSRALQDLARVHNISPEQAHRSGVDVETLISLLQARNPLGGPNYMGMLLGGAGPLTPAQQMLGTFSSSAAQLKAQYARQLSEAPRFGYPERRVNVESVGVPLKFHKYDTQQYGAAGVYVATAYGAPVRQSSEKTIIVSRGNRLDDNYKPAIEGGLEVRGVRGSGGTEEPTPQNIGASALALARRQSTLNEFTRNSSIYSSPAAAHAMMGILQGQLQDQEKIQAYGGKRVRPEKAIRSGEDVFLAAIRGTNTQLRNRRALEALVGSGISQTPEGPRYSEVSGPRHIGSGLGEGRDVPSELRTNHLQNILNQRWAKPTGDPTSYWLTAKEIEHHSLIGNPKMVQRAAQMANILGPTFGRFSALMKVIELGQAAGRIERSKRVAAEQGEARQKYLDKKYLEQVGQYELPGLGPTPTKRVYIAGPMRGIPELNFPEFFRIEKLWRNRGWDVINPAQMDKDHGYVPTKDQTSFANLSIEQAMARDLPAVASASAIALMSGWEKSQGANLELGHARRLGKKVYDANTGLPVDWQQKNLEETISPTIGRAMHLNPEVDEQDNVRINGELYTFSKTNGRVLNSEKRAYRGFNPAEILQIAQRERVQFISTPNEERLRRTLPGIGNLKVTETPRRPRGTIAEELIGAEASPIAEEKSTARDSLVERLKKLRTVGSKFLKEESGESTFEGLFGSKVVGMGRSILDFLRGPTIEQRDPAAELRQMRRDDSIEKMQRAAQKAAQTLEEYERVIRPQKLAQAQDRLTAAQEKAARSEEDRISKIDASASKSQQRIGSRISSLNAQERRGSASFDASRSRLRFDEFNAEMRAEQLEKIHGIRVDRLKNTQRYRDAPQAIRDTMLAELDAPVIAANVKYHVAQYRREAFEAPNDEALQQAKAEAAYKVAAIYGRNTDEFRDRVASSLPQPRGGLISRTEDVERLLDEQKRLKEQQVKIDEDADEQRAETHRKYQKMGTQGEEKHQAEINSINQKHTQARANLANVLLDSEARIDRAKKRHALEDEVRGGGPGGGGRGSGSGGGGGHGGFNARSGFDFGIGLAALAGYSVALRELTMDTVQYAARTEQLRVVTEQMARTNNVNTNSLNAYVEATKRRNVTTQESYSHIQKMIQANLDVAKAPDLIRVTQNLSAITGRDPAETLEAVTMGLVTGYTRQLHQAGLQVSRLSVNRQLRGELGREPNEVEQREGLLNAVLVEGSRTMGTFEKSLGTAAGQFQLLKIQIQETKNAIGNEFLPAYGQMIQLVTNGLKVMQDNPVGSSRAISGAIGVGAGVGILGTSAFAGWAGRSVLGFLGSMTPVGRVATLGAAALGAYSTYQLMNPDKDSAVVQNTKDIWGRLDESQKNLRDSNPQDQSATARNTHDVFVETTKSLQAAKEDVRSNAVDALARNYMARQESYRDLINKSQLKQGISGFIEGQATQWMNLLTNPSKGLTGTGWSGSLGLGPALQDVPALGITKEEQQRRIEQIQKEQLDANSLDPHIFREQKKLSTAIASINQAQIEVDQLERGFEPGGKEQRAIRRVVGRDNPLAQIQLDYEDFDAHIKDLKSERATVYAEFQKNPGNIAAREAVRRADLVIGDQEKVLGQKKKEGDLERGYLYRKLQVEKDHDEESVELARVRGKVVQGNYASEQEAIKKTYDLQVKYAALIYSRTGNPLEREKTISSAQAAQEQANIALVANQENAARARREFLVMSGGKFSAEEAFNDPRLTIQQALLKGYRDEMQATEQLSNDEEKRRNQLELTLQLRESLVNAARQEIHDSAEVNVAMAGNRASLEEMIDRIQAGRGAARPGYRGEGRSQNEQALQAIERQRERGRELVEYRAEQELTDPKARREEVEKRRKLGLAQVELEADQARLAQLDRNRQLKEDELADTYRVQARRTAQLQRLQSFGPGEEIASVTNAHNSEMEAINKVYEARGRGADAEKEKRRAMLEEEYQYTEKLLDLRKQKYEESRQITGSLFDAFVDSTVNRNPAAMTQFLQNFALGQAKTMFQNFASGSMNHMFENFSRVGPQFATVNGRQVPTGLGRILAGTMFGAVPQANPLVDVTKESVTAEHELTKAVKDLDETIKSLNEKKAVMGDRGYGGYAGTKASGANALDEWLNVPGVGKIIGDNVQTVLRRADIPGAAAAPGGFLNNVFSNLGGLGYKTNVVRPTQKEAVDEAIRYKVTLPDGRVLETPTVPANVDEGFTVHTKNGRILKSPSKQVISNLVDQFSKVYGVRPELAQAIANQESGYNATAVSKSGAVGVMQLMPKTAKELGVTDSTDPSQNIAAGLKMFSRLQKKYGSDELALAAYNAGEGAVDRAKGVPNIPETQNYVKSIMAVAAMNRTPTVELGTNVGGGPGVMAAIAGGLGGVSQLSNVFGAVEAANVPGATPILPPALETPIDPGKAFADQLNRQNFGDVMRSRGIDVPSTPPPELQGSVPIASMDVKENGRIIGNTGLQLVDGGLKPIPKDANVVDGFVQPGPTKSQMFGQGLQAFGANLGGGRHNILDVIKGNEVRVGVDDSTMEHISTPERVGELAGDAGTVIAGTMTAVQQFKRGGAKGTFGGISAVTGTAAAVDPEPVSKAILGTVSFFTGLASALFPDPKAKRLADINQLMELQKYRPPPTLTAEIAASGGAMAGEDRFGMARNTGLAQFPFNVQQNQLNLARVNTNKPDQSFLFIPGRQLGPTGAMASNTSPYSPNYISPSSMEKIQAPAAPQVTIHLPISAMDSTDVLRRSSDIAAAISKEIKFGGNSSDLNYLINQTIFGAG